MSMALMYSSNNGFCSEASYPYVSGETGSRETCKDSSCDKDSFTISGFRQLRGVANLEEDL